MAEYLTPPPQVDIHPEDAISSDSVKSAKGAFDDIGRNLTEDDLRSPGTVKLLLRDLDKYEACMGQLEHYKGQFHEKDKQVAVLTEQNRANISFQLLYSVGLSAGSVLLGLIPALMEKLSVLIVVSIVGGVLIIASGAIVWIKLKKSSK